MRQYTSLLCAAPFCVALAACAAPDSTGPQLTTGSIASEADYQESLVLTQQLADKQRVQNVAYVVLTRNADLCGKKTNSRFGFLAFNNELFPPKRRHVPEKLWELDDRLKIMHVVPGSPAEQAGVQSGMHIVSIDGRAPSSAKEADTWLAEVLEDKDQITMVIEQGGAYQKLQIDGRRSCTYPVQINQSKEQNASTDGKSIWVDTGMLRIATSDDELAGVIAHELAHINEKHIQMKTQNAVAGSIGGMVIDIAFAAAGVNTGGAFTSSLGEAGAQAFSQDFEKEADYVGSYYAARAGYDVGKSAEFWRKLALENPNSVRYAGTHPTSSERFLALSATATEIAQKQASGQALMPNKPKARPAVVAQNTVDAR